MAERKIRDGCVCWLEKSGDRETAKLYGTVADATLAMLMGEQERERQPAGQARGGRAETVPERTALPERSTPPEGAI